MGAMFQSEINLEWRKLEFTRCVNKSLMVHGRLSVLMITVEYVVDIR